MSEQTTKRIRVLVANKPRLMRDLVLSTIADQPDMEVVGEDWEESEILATLQNTRPDFLVISLDATDHRPLICDQVLEKYPQLRVVAIAAHRDSVIYYWQSPEIRSSSINTSEGGVLTALRGKIDSSSR